MPNNNNPELSPSQTTPEFSHSLELGKKYLEEGQFKEALGCLELAIDLQTRPQETSMPYFNPLLSNTPLSSTPQANPSLGAAYLGAGQCLFAMGKLDKAAHYLQQSLNLNPDCKETKRTLTALRYVGITEIEGLQRPPIKSSSNATKSCWDIIIFSPCGVTELGGGQHPPQIARALEQLDHQVLYFQPFWGENYSEPFTVYQDPFLLQNGSPTSFQKDLLETLMTQFFGESGNTQKLALFTIFSPYLLGCVDFLKEQGFQCGYWCLDDWSEMNWPLVVPGTENKLVDAMDFTLATNGLLSKKIESLTGKPCPTVANGFSQHNFSQDSERALAAAPSDLLKGEELTFIYWGNLANQWIDWPLLQGIVERHPEWAFNLIGFFPPDRPFPFSENLNNVKFLGMKPVHTLADYGRASDIGFIHFENSPLIQSVNPVKAYEYLACGLPIISSVIPDLDSFPNTFQVTSPQGFEEAVRQIQKSGLLKNREPEKVLTFLEKSTWKSRAERLLEHALLK